MYHHARTHLTLHSLAYKAHTPTHTQRTREKDVMTLEIYTFTPATDNIPVVKRSAVAEFSTQGSETNNRQAHQASYNNKMTRNVE
jgi:hypothetical protein